MVRINLVCKLDEKVYTHMVDWKVIEEAINNIRFLDKDSDHLKKYFLKNDFPKHHMIHPEEGGIIVIDFDSDSIVSYQNQFIFGTMKRDRVNKPLLKELYDRNKIILDKIDYMIDIRPYSHDNYDADYPCEADLARYQIYDMGFELGVFDTWKWGFWAGTTLKPS